MAFSSFTFLWLFFPAFFLSYRLIPDEWHGCQNALLLAASLLFYSWGQPYLVLLIFCILTDYAFGFLIGDISRNPSGQGGKNKLFLAVAIVLNLSVLGYFKYYDFIKNLLNHLFGCSLSIGNVAVPVGVSFFTFKSISYLVDIYRRKLPVQRNLISLGLYISFFPHIMSGPIAQYEEMALQIDGTRSLSANRTAYGVKRFIYGFGKKILIADQLGAFVDEVFGMSVAAVPGAWYWLVMLSYTLQIYFDFSGYSDMAIGLGEMFGFSVEENFNYPYLSCSLREFWRRWHMSLNRWFQNYLYIPLGGSRRGNAITLRNLLIVFFITGLWHGAGLHFIVWGLWHGVFMLIERTAFGKWLDKPKSVIVSRLYTLLVVSFGWMIFRADGMRNAIEIFKAMFTLAAVPAAMPLALYMRPHTAFALASAVLICGPAQELIPSMRVWTQDKETIGLLQTLWLLIVIIISMIMAMSSTYSSFIYFKF